MEWIVRYPDELSQVACEFLSIIGSRRLFALRGAMGVGKTTFVRAVCQELVVTDVVNSPTFAIINQYSDPDGLPIYHFDFYRINCLEEAFDFGYEEYIYSDALCFIEWPELIESLLPEGCTDVLLEQLEDGSRRITIE